MGLSIYYIPEQGEEHVVAVQGAEDQALRPLRRAGPDQVSAVIKRFCGVKSGESLSQMKDSIEIALYLQFYGFLLFLLKSK